MAVPGPPPPVPALGHRPALDGVRGVAIVLVVLFHCFGWPRNGGTLGVEVFFVLSGFLITTLLVEEHEGTGTISLRGFYLRRAYRLLPLLYVTLAVVSAVVAIAGVTRTTRNWYVHSVAATALHAGNLYNVFWENILVPALGHLWSLGVEEQFYAVWPIAVLLLLRRCRPQVIGIVAAGIVVAVVVRAVAIEAGSTVWSLPTTYADALLGGALVALWRCAGRPLPRLGPLAVPVLAASVLVPFVALESGRGLAYLWPAAVGVVVLLAGLDAPAWLTPRPLVALGRISYGVYVVHVPVFVGLVALTGDRGWRVGVATTAATLVLATISRQTLEAWFLRRKPERPGRRPRADAREEA